MSDAEALSSTNYQGQLYPIAVLGARKTGAKRKKVSATSEEGKQRFVDFFSRTSITSTDTQRSGLLLATTERQEDNTVDSTTYPGLTHSSSESSIVSTTSTCITIPDPVDFQVHIDNEISDANEQQLSARLAEVIIDSLPDSDENADKYLQLESELNCATTTPTNDNGIIRVGRVERPYTAPIKSAPIWIVKRAVYRKTNGNLHATDAHMLNASIDDIRQHEVAIRNHLTLCFHQLSNNYYQRYCDYTGDLLYWNSSPFSLSFEATYPFVVHNEEIKYHALPNIAAISTSLNFLKGQNPPIALPVLRSMLDAADEADFHLRKRLMSWSFNAMMNVSSLGQIFSTFGAHNRQITI